MKLKLWTALTAVARFSAELAMRAYQLLDDVAFWCRGKAAHANLEEIIKRNKDRA